MTDESRFANDDWRKMTAPESVGIPAAAFGCWRGKSAAGRGLG